MANLFQSRSTGSSLNFVITVVVEPDDPGFHAYCPAFKGLHVDGETVEEALENAKDAVIAYLNSHAKHGDPLPIGPHFQCQRDEGRFEVPAGGFLQDLTLRWPTPSTSGIK